MTDPILPPKSYTKNPKCLICKNKNCARIDQDLRSDPNALDLYAKSYKVTAIDLVSHALQCLGEPIAIHAEHSEDAAKQLQKRGLAIVKQSTLDPAILRVGTAMLAKAAELRRHALQARGIGVGATDLARSEAFKVFIRALTRELMDPRFAIDDHAALRAMQKLCEDATGRV